MGLILTAPKLVFFEPVPLVTIHSSGLAQVKVIAGDMHFALFAAQPCLLTEETENIINHRQAMPLAGVLDALPIVIAAAAEATGMAAVEIVKRLVVRSALLH